MLFLWVLGCMSAAVCIRGDMRVEVYDTVVDYAAEALKTRNLTLKLRSKVECAVQCTTNKDCLTFFFDKNTSTCRLSNAVVDATNSRVYGSISTRQIGCSKNLGYKIYTDGDVKLCMKIVVTAKTHELAEQACDAEGGHLIQMRSENEYRLINGTLSENHVFRGFWADGRGSDNVFTTADGQSVPWLTWGPGEPDRAGVNCLRLLSSVQYLFADNRCDVDRPYVCQID